MAILKIKGEWVEVLDEEYSSELNKEIKRLQEEKKLNDWKRNRANYIRRKKRI